MPSADCMWSHGLQRRCKLHSSTRHETAELTPGGVRQHVSALLAGSYSTQLFSRLLLQSPHKLCSVRGPASAVSSLPCLWQISSKTMPLTITSCQAGVAAVHLVQLCLVVQSNKTTAVMQQSATYHTSCIQMCRRFKHHSLWQGATSMQSICRTSRAVTCLCSDPDLETSDSNILTV